MKVLVIIILFIGFNAFSQTFDVVNKGYYYGKVGEVILPNRTTDLKALTDVQEYLDNNNLESGEVVRPTLEVKRKKTLPTPPTIIRDTVYINNGDISIGNQWMGEPIKSTIVYGKIISDTGGSHSVGGVLESVFDGNIATFRRANNQQGAWVGQDFEVSKAIHKIRIYPHNLFNGTDITLNGCTIQYSDDGQIWNNLHIISTALIHQWYEFTFNTITARYWRVVGTPSGSYGGHIAELEFYQML